MGARTNATRTVLALCAAAAALPSGFSLVGDHRSLRVDDVVTVLVEEDNNAANTARTKTGSEANGSVGVSAGSGLLGFLPSAKADGGLSSDFLGEGATSRTGSMQAVVSARILEVMPNGSLRIEGSKQVAINDETEVISVAGLLRPEDIDADNTVSSSRLADARIAYSGRGASGGAAKPGVFTRFLDWLF